MTTASPIEKTLHKKPERPRPTPLAYRPKDAASVLGVSRAQLYRLIADGVIVARKLGGATLIRHEELMRVLDTTKAIQASIK